MPLGFALLALALSRAPAPAVAPAPPAQAPLAPAEVMSLVAAGHALVEARQADLDGDGSPEWILVTRFDHPTRLDRGPRSAEWRAGQRIESRVAHQLSVVGREGGVPVVRFSAEMGGNERQAILVQPLLGADGRTGRSPALVTGVRACAGSCGPVEAHLVVWDPRRRAYADYAYVGAELVILGSDGAAELWFADRRPGDPICCASGYTVTRVGMYGPEIDTLSTTSVPADRMRRVLPPGGLILRADPPKARSAARP